MRVEDYLALPYTITVQRYTEGDHPVWLAQVVELPGCTTDADTMAELELMLREAMEIWIESALEAGLPVPEPWALEDASGRFLVRAPKSLHRQVAEAAQRDGVSLNAWVNVALARAVGAASAMGAASAAQRAEPQATPAPAAQQTPVKRRAPTRSKAPVAAD